MSTYAPRCRLPRRPGSLPRLLAALAVGIACPTEATTQEQPTAHADAPVAPVATAVDTRGIEAILVQLDDAFQRGDVTAYCSMFLPDHPGVHGIQKQRLEDLVAATPARRRTSTVQGEPRTVGQRTVARVRAKVWLGESPQGRTRAEFVEDSLLALLLTSDGRIQPTFCVEIPTDWNWSRRNGVRCPPCNYEIGGVAGWLCVPVRGDRANAMEAASFYLLGTDIACDVSVTVDPSPVPAATLVADLGRSLQSLAGGAQLQPAEPWLPPAFVASPPKAVDAARLTIDLPPDGRAEHGGRAWLHVVTIASLQHILLMRGSAASLHAEEAAVRALLGSYRLLQIDGDDTKIATEARLHHCGGQFEGRTYRNDLYRVQMNGPDGWSTQHRAGGAAFRARWNSAAGSSLWLSGHPVPPGMPQWCRETADAWLRDLCAQQGLRITAGPGGDSGWQDEPSPGTSTAAVRTVLLTPLTKGRGPAETPDDAVPIRVLRLHLEADLLLLADGLGVTPADQVAVRAALTTLRRR